MNLLSNLIFLTESSGASEATASQGWLSTLVTWGPLVLIVVLFYFLLIRP